jgi:hypothetical protein
LVDVIEDLSRQGEELGENSTRRRQSKCSF